MLTPAAAHTHTKLAVLSYLETLCPDNGGYPPPAMPAPPLPACTALLGCEVGCEGPCCSWQWLAAAHALPPVSAQPCSPVLLVLFAAAAAVHLLLNSRIGEQLVSPSLQPTGQCLVAFPMSPAPALLLLSLAASPPDAGESGCGHAAGRGVGVRLPWRHHWPMATWPPPPPLILLPHTRIRCPATPPGGSCPPPQTQPLHHGLPPPPPPPPPQVHLLSSGGGGPPAALLPHGGSGLLASEVQCQSAHLLGVLVRHASVISDALAAAGRGWGAQGCAGGPQWGVGVSDQAGVGA